MSISIPPDIDTLRRLVRGQLPRSERIEVDRWLGRCVDPSLPQLLEGLVAEWREEQRDLSMKAPIRNLSQLFGELLRSSRATLDEVMPFRPASLGVLSLPGSRDEGLWLTAGSADGTVEIQAIVESPADRIFVVASNDIGQVHVLLDRRPERLPLSIDDADAYEIEPHEGRVTVWLTIVSASTPQPPNDPEAFRGWLATVAADGRIYAARVTDRDVLNVET